MQLDDSLRTLCAGYVGVPTRSVPGWSLFASVAKLLGISVDKAIETAVCGLGEMLSMGEAEVLTLGFTWNEVRMRLGRIVNPSFQSLRRSSELGCNMDFTAISRRRGCLVVVVSNLCITVYPPFTSSMSLSALPVRCPHLLNVNPRCLILADVGQCRFKPIFSIGTDRASRRSFSTLPRLADLNIP